MRKGFDGLIGLPTQWHSTAGCRPQQMGRDACSGDVYIFLGKRLDRMKLLVWEASGFLLYYKRLEAGTFQLPKGENQSIQITYSELSLLLEGIEVEVKHRRKRYSKILEKA